MPIVLNSRIQQKIVKHDSAEVKTTQLPASSLSPPICCAIANDTTAQGVPKIAISVTKSIPLNPSAIAIDSIMAGTIRSLPIIQPVS